MQQYIVRFDRYQATDRARVGGKNASLGEMMAAGLPVPPGFAITTDGYHTLRDHPEVRETVRGLLAAADLGDQQGLEQISQEVRRIIEAASLDATLVEQVRAAYARLCEHCALDDAPVAVRSSATAEDLPNASFAGEHDSYLWIRGADSVLDRVSRCWSSIFTARAISYRRQMGYDDVISMSVGVQRMVLPRTAGVAFTLNPINGDRSIIAIDASWGLGEAVVAGEVNPDNFLVDKVLFEIVHRAISCKAIEYRVTDAHLVERVAVDRERQTLPSLTDHEVRAVASLARKAEKHYGQPQDIEWAIDSELPDGANVVLLQSRPETVWSRRTREPIAPGTGVESILTTLLSPLNSRELKQKERAKKT